MRKFNVDEAFNTLERAYMGPKRYPQFFEVNEDLTKRASDLFDTGFCYPLMDRDAEGRKILYLETAKLDPSVYTAADGIRLLCYIVAVLLEEEETQIAGIVFILDDLNLTMKHLALISPMDIRDFMDLAKNMSPARQKASYALNLPPIANFMIELFMAAMNEKIRSRFKLLKNPDELKDHIDPAILPIKYGGTRTQEEMMNAFRKLEEASKEKIDLVLNYKIDWDKVPREKIFSKEECETVGSFRKLEID